MSERSIVTTGWLGVRALAVFIVTGWRLFELSGRTTMGLLPDSSCSAMRRTFGVVDLPRDALRTTCGAIAVASPYGRTARAGSCASGWYPGAAGCSSSCAAGALLAAAAAAAPCAAAEAALLVALLTLASSSSTLAGRLCCLLPRPGLVRGTAPGPPGEPRRGASPC